MSKFKVITTEKLEGQTKTLVRQAAAKQNPGYRVASVGVTEDGTKWEVRLDVLQPDRESNRTRQAAPPDFLKKDEEEGSADEEAAESPEDEAKEDAEGDSDAGTGDEEDGTEDSSKDKKDKGKEDPVAAIEKIMGELNSLLSDLGGHAQKLKEKADKVDEIHDLAAPDVDKMEAVPPVDDAAQVQPTPGEGPPPGLAPPRKPPVPTGKGPSRPVGVPTFSKTQLVEHPIKDEDGEYSLTDFLAAISNDSRFASYEVDEVKKLEENNVYSASLKLKS